MSTDTPTYYERVINQARSEHKGDRDRATWCGSCIKAWPGHVVPDGHSLEKYPGSELHHADWLDFTAEPPDDGKCHCCDDWQPFDGVQSHFGYGWWRNDERRAECDHAHHQDEVWLA